MRTRIRKLGLAAVAATAVAAGAPSTADACGDRPFMGEVCAVAYGFCPVGYAEALGQLLPIDGYQALYGLLGTIYGGDGRTTFALPDLRGRLPIGDGIGPALPNYPLGRPGGTSFVTLTADNLPAHAHAVTNLPITATATLNGTTQSADATSPAQALPAATRTGTYSVSGPVQAMAGMAVTVSGTAGSGTTGSAGGGNQPVDNRQPFMATRYCIAIVGAQPPRP